MSLIPVLLTPLALLLPVANSAEQPSAGAPFSPNDFNRLGSELQPMRQDQAMGRAGTVMIIQSIADSHQPRPRFQVRIEQRTTIRITPLHTPMPVRRSMLSDLPDRPQRDRMVERNIGRCLSAATISGVQPDTGANRLLLFMRDRRVVTAQLERSCRARDFYSGFYLARSPDGRMCVDRDVLLSRSGVNCRITRMRQLVRSDD